MYLTLVRGYSVLDATLAVVFTYVGSLAKWRGRGG